jgi:hypothetical protein
MNRQCCGAAADQGCGSGFNKICSSGSSGKKKKEMKNLQSFFYAFYFILIIKKKFRLALEEISVQDPPPDAQLCIRIRIKVNPDHQLPVCMRHT